MLVDPVECIIHLRLLFFLWIDQSDQRVQVLRILARHFYGVARNFVELDRELLQELTSDFAAQLNENS